MDDMDDIYRKVSEGYTGFNRMSFIARCYEGKLSSGELGKVREIVASGGITKVVPFDNSDIIDFLERLDRFEKSSERRDIVVC